MIQIIFGVFELANKLFLLCGLIFSVSVFGQEVVVKPSTGDRQPLPIKSMDIKEKRKIIAPIADPESEANIAALSLMDLKGNSVTPEIDRVTVIEYWSKDSHPDNLYWNRMRELEHRFEGSSEIQFISINYDYVRTGASHIEMVNDFLKSNTAPKNLYLDKDDGFRDVFYVPGPVSYLLIDHRKQYTNVGRGDDPETAKLFDKLVENAIEYQRRMKKPRSNQLRAFRAPRFFRPQVQANRLS